MSLGIVLTSAGVTLEWPPLPQFGVGVLDADPIRGLPSAHLSPRVLIAERYVVLRLLRRGADRGREFVGQTPVALVDLGSHFWAELELLGDALGAHRGLVVHAAQPVRTGPQQAALAIADRSGLDGVLLLLARDERPSSEMVGLGPADLGLDSVDPQPDSLGFDVGEDVRQGAQPHPGAVRDCESARRQERADLSDGAGDR